MHHNCSQDWKHSSTPFKSGIYPYLVIFEYWKVGCFLCIKASHFPIENQCSLDDESSSLRISFLMIVLCPKKIIISITYCFFFIQVCIFNTNLIIFGKAKLNVNKCHRSNLPTSGS